MYVNLCPVSELAGPDTHLPAIGPTYYQNADFIIKNPIILSKTALLLSKTQIYYQNLATYYQKSNFIIKNLQPRRKTHASINFPITSTQNKKGKLPHQRKLTIFHSICYASFSML
jgi:hypothetical protein